MDKLEWQIDSVDGNTFEKIAGEILRNDEYTVHESGVIGTDGGWDARIRINDKKGIAHASVRNDWRQKLRQDAEKVKKLEEKSDDKFDILVFLTNQKVTGKQELELEEEIEKEYGWNLKIIHRRPLIGIIGDERPDLAERHFGFNPKREDDHIDKIHKLKEKRLETISNREGVANNLELGPSAVIHLIPNGVFSGNYVDLSGDIPNLPRMGKLNPFTGSKKIGKGKITNYSPGSQSFPSYNFLGKDGLFEAVDTLSIRRDDEGNLKIRNARKGTDSLDFLIGVSVLTGINNLKEIGVTGNVFCFISLLDAKGATMTYEKKIAGPGSQRPLNTDKYSTDFVEISLENPQIVDSLEVPINEIWQEVGWKRSLHFNKDGQWMGDRLEYEDLVFPPNKES